MANDKQNSAESPASIGPDSFVTLSYVLFDEQGRAVDSTSEPLTYVHGYAQIVPGLERALLGMKKGDKQSIVIEPDEAFGIRDESGIFQVDKEDFPNSDGIAAGDEFLAQGPNGEPMTIRIVEVLSDAFVVDTNHPLAGQRVRFDVQVGDVRPASDKEIEEAQSELESWIQEEGHSCCDHDHGSHHHSHQNDEESLIQLGKNRA